LGLTVTNLDRSKQFYQELFGWKELGADPKMGYAFLSDGKTMITLWQQSQHVYDKARAGLHHFALAVGSPDDLVRAEQVLRKKNVRIHYDRIVPAMEGAKEAELYFYDPDGIRVELFSAQGGEGKAAPVRHGPSCFLPD
jgi:lactoylglutathione lyase